MQAEGENSRARDVLRQAPFLVPFKDRVRIFTVSHSICFFGYKTFCVDAIWLNLSYVQLCAHTCTQDKAFTGQSTCPEVLMRVLEDCDFSFGCGTENHNFNL